MLIILGFNFSFEKDSSSNHNSQIKFLYKRMYEIFQLHIFHQFFPFDRFSIDLH